MNDENTCRASRNVPVTAEPADERNLYCVLPDGHADAHWDDGAEVAWRPWTSEQEAARARHDWKRAL